MIDEDEVGDVKGVEFSTIRTDMVVKIEQEK